jgi:transposase
MAKERLSMRKFKEVLRLKFDHQLSNRKIAKSCNLSHVTVGKYLTMAEEAGISWPLPEHIDDGTFERQLFQAFSRAPTHKPLMPDMEYLFRELKRKHVTLQLLWYEYKQAQPDGYQYSYFCELYHRWRSQLDVCLRQEHRAGEKLFIDYAGQTVPIIDPKTSNTLIEAQIFVAALGASNYTYAEASASQTLPDWIQSHIRAFTFFGGVSQILVPDNLKSGVTAACRYEPDINPTYLDLAQHYGTTVIPARPGKPRDKAKVESAVLVAERWILAALRNHTFFSLAELNQAIDHKLIEFNQHKLKKINATRKQLFETIDRPALLALPKHRYEYALWKKARVNIDYHIEVHRSYYSVPYTLRKQQVDVRISASTIEVLFKNKRVASHVRSYRKGSFTTSTEHMPKAHQKYLQWTPSRIIRWAQNSGPNTEKLVTQIMQRRSHPEQGFRACMGIMRLGKRFTDVRLENACARAITIGAYSYKSVESILKKGLDQQPLLPDQPQPEPVAHPNLRGHRYYQLKEK